MIKPVDNGSQEASMTTTRINGEQLAGVLAAIRDRYEDTYELPDDVRPGLLSEEDEAIIAELAKEQVSGSAFDFVIPHEVIEPMRARAMEKFEQELSEKMLFAGRAAFLEAVLQPSSGAATVRATSVMGVSMGLRKILDNSEQLVEEVTGEYNGITTLGGLMLRGDDGWPYSVTLYPEERDRIEIEVDYPTA
jgi:hypothetical protein